MLVNCVVCAVPSAPRGLQLKLVEDQDPPIITVTWQTPRSTYGEVTGYRLSYGIKGERSEARPFDGNVFRFQTGYLGRTCLREG